jgi:8-oxo-dGTP diphosphatase
MVIHMADKKTYTYEYPMFTITSDILLYDKKEKEFLLIKRKNEPFKDWWALPGGFVNIDETILQAAKRELLEETGINCDELQITLIPSIVMDKVDRDPRYRTVTRVFVGNCNSKTIKVVPNDDAIEFKWVKLSEIDMILFAFDHKEIIEKLLTEIKKD